MVSRASISNISENAPEPHSTPSARSDPFHRRHPLSSHRDHRSARRHGRLSRTQPRASPPRIAPRPHHRRFPRRRPAPCRRKTARAGAHPLDSIRPPDLTEYQTWQKATNNAIRLITISPHWPGATDYIGTITSDGVTVSIGHTGATAEQITAAVDAGATLSTHIGNAAHTVLPKHPNYIWDQLAEDRLSASFIVDGIHLGAAFLRAAVRAKTISRSVLVTDASAPAGAAPGRYRLGRQEADLTEDGRVVLTGTNRLAGSALKMNPAVSNTMRMAGISLSDAVDMATINPARIVHLEGRSQGLEVGERADIVLFRSTPGIAIDSVYLDGKRISLP